MQSSPTARAANGSDKQTTARATDQANADTSSSSSATKPPPRSTPQRSPKQSRQQQQQEADLREFDAIMARQSNGAAAIAARNAQLAARMKRPSYASASPDSSAVDSSGSDSDDPAPTGVAAPRIISERLDDLMDESSDRDVEDRMAHGHARMFPRDAAAAGVPLYPSYDEQGRQVWPAIDPVRLLHAQQRQQNPQQTRQMQASASEPEDSDADELNRSGELNPAELNALLHEASQLTGLSPTGAASASSRNTGGASAATAAATEGDSPVTLHAKLVSERAAMGQLLEKLGALQSQAARLLEMSTLTNRSQAQMQAVLADTRNLAAPDAGSSESEGEDAEQSPMASSGEEPLHDQRRVDTRSKQPQRRQQQPYSTASPSNSDIEVEIERQPSSASASAPHPSESDDEELSHDAAQLAQLEDWMSVLSKQSEMLKAQRQAAMTPAERERDEEEFETDQRLFFTQPTNSHNHSSSNEGRARNRSAGVQRGGRTSSGARHDRFEAGADEEELRERARRQLSTRSPITSASPSPPRMRERVRSAPSRGSSSQPQDYSPARARSQKSAPRSPVSGIARVPVRAVPPVPISRWIGPSALPTAHAGGGSGSHVQYSDRPATAVGTARSAVARAPASSSLSHQSSQTSSSPGGANGASSVSWQAPTLSSLPPRPRQHKAASVSSKGSSLFVNAPSERGGQHRRYGWTEGSEIAEQLDDDDAASESFDDEDEGAEEYSEEEDEEESEGEDSDSDWFVTVTQHGANHARAAASAAAVAAIASSPPDGGASPSDCDSELPYAINGPSASNGGRPKTARTAASSHLNGHAAMAKAARAVSGRQPSQPFQPSHLTAGRHQPQPPLSSRGPLLLDRRALALAHIGLQLLRHTLDHVGNTRARGTELGGGRLGATTTQRQQAAAANEKPEERAPTRQQQQQQRAHSTSHTQQSRGYGFEPAIPTRAWPSVSGTRRT